MSKTMKFTIGMLLLAVIVLTFGTGYYVSRITYRVPIENLGIVEEVWHIIFTDYVDRAQLDSQTMSQAAIEGMIKELDDPYTSYLEAENYELGLSNLEGEFEGIGAHVTIKDEQLTIIAPIAGSAAEKAGIKAGDIILEVDGEPTAGMSLAKAVMKIRGTQGTSVRLLILHEGESEPVVIEIIRTKVELSSVYFEMRGDIAYINITQFSENTDEELSPILQEINEAKKARGIILDMRHNPGGLLDTVIEIASFFLHEGTVVDVVSNQEKVTSLNVKSSSVITDLPMVVLVDEYSASGSEVLSGALQDYGRAVIAGTTTYGKGSVNILRRLSDGSGLYITTARWRTPQGRLIEGEGITPDYELELTGEDAIRWAIGYLTSQ